MKLTRVLISLRRRDTEGRTEWPSNFAIKSSIKVVHLLSRLSTLTSFVMPHPVHNPANPTRRLQGLQFAKPGHRHAPDFPPAVASMLGFIDIFDTPNQTIDEAIEILKSQPPPPEDIYPPYLFWQVICLSFLLVLTVGIL